MLNMFYVIFRKYIVYESWSIIRIIVMVICLFIFVDFVF